MPFIQDDIYTVSAGATLYNYWNPFVTKFDTSSFYSWEEDNVPVFDLEERTDFLWEKMGWPTSSIPGLVLSVTGTIDDQISLSSNQFLTIQDAIASLPEVLRFPTLIEVCLDTDLGDIELKDIKCVGEGKLEIVNRAFGVLSGIGDLAQAGATPEGTTKFKSSSTGNFHGAAYDSSCLLTEQNTSDLILSSDNSMAMFMGVPYQSKGGAYYVNTAIGDSSNKLSEAGGVLTYNAPDVTLGSSPYQDTSTDPDPIDSAGTSLKDDYGRGLAVNEKVVGLYAGNTATGIKISNCEGPIWIRGFIVNAATGSLGGSNHVVVNDNGIEIDNSHGITIEDCAVSRAGVAGLRVINSKISLNRRFFASRNYDANTRGANDDHGILAENSHIVFDQNLWPTASISQDNNTQVIGITAQKYGIKLVNSRISGGTNLNALNADGSFVTANTCETSYVLESSVIDLNGTLDSYNSLNGFSCYNSTIKSDTIVAHSHEDTALHLVNSNLEYNKNLTKLTTFSSKTFGNTLAASYYPTKNFFLANGQHIVSKGSSMKPAYTKDSMPNHHTEFTLIDNLKAGFIDDGGSPQSASPGVELNNSEAEFVSLYSRNNISFSEVTKGRHLHITNGSTCTLRGTKSGATLLSNDDNLDAGCNVYVSNNSNLIVAGPTVICDMESSVVCDGNSKVVFGPHYKNGTDYLATQEWSLSDSGNHTSVMVYGIKGCLIANNGSVIQMTDIGHFQESWFESSVSGTDVYLNPDTTSDHALKANFCSAGSFTFLPHTNTVQTPVALKAYNGNTTSKLLSAQSPPRVFTSTTTKSNGQDGYLINVNEFEIDLLSNSQAAIDRWRQVSNGGVCVKALSNSVVDLFNVNFIQGPVNADDVYLDPSQNTTGGCNDLRIWSFAGGSSLKASQLSVSGSYPSSPGYTGPRALYYTDPTLHLESYSCSDVEYTAFMSDPYLSGQRYVPNPPQFTRITVDAINDSTRNLIEEVSGYGYYEDLPLSSLAILDFYGVGCSGCSGIPEASGISPEREYFRAWSVKRFGIGDGEIGFGTPASAIENYGPYRLYLEIDPAARSLMYEGADDSDVDSRPFQTLAQGYFLSASCSATASAMDDWYNSLRVVSTSSFNGVDGSGYALSSFSLSGYFHPSLFCRPNNYNILIDESASNTFANSKNAALPLLGRPKLVDIYRATTTDGGSAANPAAGYGSGFKMTSIFDFGKDI